MMRATQSWSAPLLLVPVPLGAHAECRCDSGGNTPVTFNLPFTITIPAGHYRKTSSSRQTVARSRQIKRACVRPDAVRPGGSSM